MEGEARRPTVEEWRRGRWVMRIPLPDLYEAGDVGTKIRGNTLVIIAKKVVSRSTRTCTSTGATSSTSSTSAEEVTSVRWAYPLPSGIRPNRVERNLDRGILTITLI